MYIKFIKAFTFVELIVCIAVLAIIASIAVPYFHQYFATLEANHIHKRIKAAANYSRAQAAMLRQNIVICPSQSFAQCQPNQWKFGFLIFVDTNRNRQLDANEQLMHIEQLNLKYGELDWRGALSMQSITYQSQTALPIGSNGSFYYCAYEPKHSQRIFLSKMGHTRMEKLTNC